MNLPVKEIAIDHSSQKHISSLVWAASAAAMLLSCGSVNQAFCNRIAPKVGTNDLLSISDADKNSSTPDVTEDIVSRMKRSIKTVEKWRSIDSSIAFLGHPSLALIKTCKDAWLVEHAQSGAVWDFKINVYEKYKSSGVLICGKKARADLMDNVHFGYVATGLGIDDAQSHISGGWAQLKAKSSTPRFYCDLFDDPVDYAHIDAGAQLYRSYGNSISSAKFCAAISDTLPECP